MSDTGEEILSSSWATGLTQTSSGFNLVPDVVQPSEIIRVCVLLPLEKSLHFISLHVVNSSR
jgi:hypothetical protein